MQDEGILKVDGFIATLLLRTDTLMNSPTMESTLVRLLRGRLMSMPRPLVSFHFYLVCGCDPEERVLTPRFFLSFPSVVRLISHPSNYPSPP